MYTVAAGGDSLVRVTRDPGRDLFPNWSPDGHRIAFSSDRTGDLEIYAARPNGEGPENLTANPTAPDFYPAYSPDGTRMHFTSGRDGDPEVYVTNADGTGQTNLSGSARKDSGADWQPVR